MPSIRAVGKCVVGLCGCRALLVGGLGAILATLGCGARHETEGRPNVLIAVFDACRPDKMGCYGFERPTTAAVDRLASDPDSVVFERHYVQSSWTKPSTASLFTGLFLHQHGVVGGSFEGQQHQWSSILPDELRTLAEHFQDAGYFTFSANSNPHLDPRFGFDQGFETYTMMRAIDEEVYAEALRLAGEAKRPFLGYLHFNGCHHPFFRWLRDEEYLSTFGFAYDEPARVAAGIDFSDPSIADEINERGLTLERDDIRFLNLLYESRLRWMDREIVEPLIDGLRQQGLYDETLIVFTADHGEELYDHRGYGHGHALWEEVIRVPLIVKFPKGGRPEELGPTWSGLSRAIDLYPSLAAAAGLEHPTGVPGLNLFQRPEIRFALADALNSGDDWALIRATDKLISYPRPRRRALLFDLGADPKETNNLAQERPESVRAGRLAVRRLWRRLPQQRTSFEDEVTQPLSEEAVETLRSLGYLD